MDEPQKKKPAPRPVVHLYIAVDKHDPRPLEPTIVALGTSRAECRKQIEFDPEADNYRVKRARATLYEK
jgi:anti-sigma-K factor RskA